MHYSNEKKRNKQMTNSTRTNLFKALLILLLLFILVVCWEVGTRVSYQMINHVPSDTSEMEAAFPELLLSNADQDTEANSAIEIRLSDFEDNVVIEEGGDYVLSGELKGSVEIDAKDAFIHLFLDDASIQAKEGPAIKVKNAEKVILTLVEGTFNIVSDNGDYRKSSDYDACIISDCDLTFNGAGSLEITGLYKDAIRTKDILRIVDGNYRIKCKRTAVHGNDGVFICGGRIFIGSEKNGIKTTKRKGDLVISGGQLSVVAGRYAFVVDKAKLYVFDCSIQTNCGISDFNVKGVKIIDDGCLK